GDMGRDSLHHKTITAKNFEPEAQRPDFGCHLQRQRKISRCQFHRLRKKRLLALPRFQHESLKVLFEENALMRRLLVHKHQTRSHLPEDVPAFKLHQPPVGYRSRGFGKVYRAFKLQLTDGLSCRVLGQPRPLASLKKRLPVFQVTAVQVMLETLVKIYLACLIGCGAFKFSNNVYVFVKVDGWRKVMRSQCLTYGSEDH